LTAENSTEIAGMNTATAEVDGLNIFYMSAGSGPAVVLIHGFAETSRVWKHVIPVLSKRFRVIAPDLPGIGDSDIPKDNIDMTTGAIRIHRLVNSLGIEKSRVVGHDFGVMVGYAYAAQFPEETEKLVLMEAPLPGIAGFDKAYNGPDWHFRFNGPTPEKLVEGRERIYFDHFWNDFAADSSRSIPEEDRRIYTEKYSRPGRMHAGWQYYISFQKAAAEFPHFAQVKLKIPVLAIGGDKSNGPLLSEQVKLVANHPEVIVLKDTGHWLMDERPDEVIDALSKFL
jgi:pimeloyl-ACP methyl ester carboxylesterase